MRRQFFSLQNMRSMTFRRLEAARSRGYGVRLEAVEGMAALISLCFRAGCFWLESRFGFPNQLRSDSTCWRGGGEQGMPKPYSQDLRARLA
jgi:hypothetical protein